MTTTRPDRADTPSRIPAYRQTPGDLVVRGPSFSRGLWRVAAADASSGNKVELLRDGPATYDAMIGLIEGAHDSIALESYMVQDDSVGRRFAEALAAAVRRGVQVRFLTDWVGSRGTGRRYWRSLRTAGIELRIFNPPGFHPWLGIVPRDHRKLLVIDDKTGITGGLGLSEKWGGRGNQDRKARWRDTAVRIDGMAAVDMASAFDRMWKRVTREERRDSARLLVRRPSGRELSPERDQGAIVGIIEGEPLRLRVARALQIQAVSAERAIWIASAYFVPSYAELEALAGAARDGVDVRVLVPSSYDHPWIRLLARLAYRRMLKNGVRLWEWKGVMMHAKTAVVDGRWVRVGSTDFNPLGIAVNYELDALIQDRGLGEAAEAMFLADLDQSTEIRLGSAMLRG
ncbi:MAG: phosphatidylserine/phosphatidylglycerophosphate/cardiolipin synthase family protein [Gemmatimonadota bacterium]|nr:phosphatidylserine/phosphatidylglycerophosphate/cardiolipin synthase family protein [Gemmatimonadota bacterium]